MSTLRFAARIIAILLLALPLIWMVGAALHPPGEPLPRTLRLLPETPSLENARRAWQMVPMTRYTLNSLFVVLLAVPLTIVTSSWAGFAISQLRPSAQRRWIVFSLLLLMVPGIALWMPRFLLYRQLDWLSSPLALIAPAWMGTSPFYILMFYRAFHRITPTLFDAARLDGASVLLLWRRIAMPSARATTLGVGLLSFIFYWGDFTSPLLYLRDDAGYTLPVGLRLLEQLGRAEWGVVMSAALYSTFIPMVLFALVMVLFARLTDGS